MSEAVPSGTQEGDGEASTVEETSDETKLTPGDEDCAGMDEEESNADAVEASGSSQSGKPAKKTTRPEQQFEPSSFAGDPGATQATEGDADETATAELEIILAEELGATAVELGTKYSEEPRLIPATEEMY